MTFADCRRRDNAPLSSFALHAKTLDGIDGKCFHLARSDETVARQAIEISERQVRRNRVRQYDTLRFAVFGSQHHAALIESLGVLICIGRLSISIEPELIGSAPALHEQFRVLFCADNAGDSKISPAWTVLTSVKEPSGEC